MAVAKYAFALWLVVRLMILQNIFITAAHVLRAGRNIQRHVGRIGIGFQEPANGLEGKALEPTLLREKTRAGPAVGKSAKHHFIKHLFGADLVLPKLTGIGAVAELVFDELFQRRQ